MRTKGKIGLMMISAAILIAMGMVGIWQDRTCILGVQTIEQDELEQTIDGKTRADIDVDLMFKQQSLPYAENLGAYMVTQSMETETWQGQIFAGKGVRLWFIMPQNGKSEIIRSGESLQLVVVKDDVYDVKSVIVSGLPVIVLNRDQDEDAQLSGTGEIVVFENNAEGKNVITATSYVSRYRNRGNMSAMSPKRQWKFNLIDDRGRARKVSLLGMQKDNDWNLNSMYYDQSRIRDMVGYALWNQMVGMKQHEMEYCEFISDGTYQGVFGVKKPVNLSTFRASSTDTILCSIKLWREQIKERDLYKQEATEILLDNGMNIDEFSIDNCTQDQIDIALELLRVLDHQCIQEEYDSLYTIEFDRESSARYAVFINMVFGDDNTYKNEKFTLHRTEKNHYVIDKLCWDLDLCMRASANEMGEILTDQLYHGDNDVLYKDMRELYISYRDNFFNAAYTNRLIDGFVYELTESGAIQREKARWPEMDFEENCQTVRDFFEQRIAVLDQYFEGVSCE